MTDETTKAVIDLLEDGIYIVSGGNLTKVTPKSHGEDVIIWKNGQPFDIIRSQRDRLEGQEVI
ncbi:hypothetical protein ACFFF5_21120 [Lederbergia wuyishanensis]|uniref:DUF3954 domain-containing protein n=1 Tax=Lederbergia wuyishanensis TaxID=1347903 RepID=A0ABU0D761_9BACI|nr:hypothetical protein [Lederbergia wuyishanensis]MCJ8008918.1 hypothetical protein [Lederbergia wuyishanensis]MDQ0344244.1 hypothetical protein [Lederbergia wuyishanensis]